MLHSKYDEKETIDNETSKVARQLTELLIQIFDAQAELFSVDKKKVGVFINQRLSMFLSSTDYKNLAKADILLIIQRQEVNLDVILEKLEKKRLETESDKISMWKPSKFYDCNEVRSKEDRNKEDIVPPASLFEREYFF